MRTWTDADPIFLSISLSCCWCGLTADPWSQSADWWGLKNFRIRTSLSQDLDNDSRIYTIWSGYLPPDTGNPNQVLLNLPIIEGWKAEFTLVLVIYLDGLPVCRVDKWPGWESNIRPFDYERMSNCYMTKPPNSYMNSVPSDLFCFMDLLDYRLF